MSQQISVPNPLTPAIVLTLEANITAAQAIAVPLKVPLSPSQQKGLIGVATNRSALITAMYTTIMEPFPDTLPNSTTLAAFQAMTQEENDCMTIAAFYTSLATIFNTHADVVKNNRMFVTTETLDNAKLMAKSDATLADAVTDIVNEYYNRSAAVGVASYTLPIGGSLVVGGIKTEKHLVNTGNSILSFLNVNGNVAETITVNPASGTVVPKGWTSINIVNLSTTLVGSFDVHLK